MSLTINTQLHGSVLAVRVMPSWGVAALLPGRSIGFFATALWPAAHCMHQFNDSALSRIKLNMAFILYLDLRGLARPEGELIEIESMIQSLLYRPFPWLLVFYGRYHLIDLAYLIFLR